MKSTVRGVAVLALCSLSACGRAAAPADPQLVAQWMRAGLVFTRSERLGPPLAGRIAAYGSLALYEGYASDPHSTLRSLAGQLNGLATLPAAPSDGAVDGATVAAEAERVVLDSLYRDGRPATRRTVDSLSKAQVAAREAAGVGSAMRDRSLAHGRALAAALLAYAATDSFYATRGRPWTAPTGRQFWVNTATTDQYVTQQLSSQSDVAVTKNSGDTLDVERATEKGLLMNRPKKAGPTTLPAFDPVKPTEPYWGVLRPFTLQDGDECKPPVPPPYSEKPGSEFYQMAQEFYDTVKALTPDKRQTALYWADNPVATGTPAFHWISVLLHMVSARHLTAEQAVEDFTLTSIAIHDAFIGCWREKYRSFVVRPVTYVQRVWDPKYVTVFATPPFPEYSSGHSVISGAAVEVLIHQLGDTTAYVDSSQVDVGQAARAYPSLSAALHEVAMSRVYGGIHYMKAVVDGMKQGQCVGQRVIKRLQTHRAG
ncbi:MAG: vanadium-dependent haloperoxidase [Gemmatimonadetes bacterium]|nr:vanadium-dependent haloperoxidase [Gemmatimonadota bacterium]MBI3569399.1 vanadium-dependent haloperoxidase [Gemmatimonadota bacterium]